jgi:hypothetical protein
MVAIEWLVYVHAVDGSSVLPHLTVARISQTKRLRTYDV